MAVKKLPFSIVAVWRKHFPDQHGKTPRFSRGRRLDLLFLSLVAETAGGTKTTALGNQKAAFGSENACRRQFFRRSATKLNCFSRLMR
jgi:hypothetical protein